MADHDWTTADYVIIGGQPFKARRQRGFPQRWMSFADNVLRTDEVLITMAKEELNPIVPARLVTEDDLTATIRQAKAEALREVADDVTSWLPLQDRTRLRQRADRIASGGDQT